MAASRPVASLLGERGRIYQKVGLSRHHAASTNEPNLRCSTARDGGGGPGLMFLWEIFGNLGPQESTFPTFFGPGF